MKIFYINKISLTLSHFKKYNEELKKWAIFSFSYWLRCVSAQSWG